MTKTVEVQTLRKVFNRLMDRLEKQRGHELDFQQTRAKLAEYWEFDLETAFACEESPSLQAGDFRSDLEEVEDVLERKEDEIVLWHDLDHFASVLRGIAYLDLIALSPDTANK